MRVTHFYTLLHRYQSLFDLLALDFIFAISISLQASSPLNVTEHNGSLIKVATKMERRRSVSRTMLYLLFHFLLVRTTQCLNRCALQRLPPIPMCVQPPARLYAHVSFEGILYCVLLRHCQRCASSTTRHLSAYSIGRI